MDCLFPFVPNKAIEVLFSYESIQPNRWGGTCDVVEMLIRNASPDEEDNPSSIADIYFLHPSRLFTTDPARTAEFARLIEQGNDAPADLKKDFNRFVSMQTPILLQPKDPSNKHLMVEGFTKLEKLPGNAAELQKTPSALQDLQGEGVSQPPAPSRARLTIYDPNPQTPNVYEGRVGASWLGTPIGLHRDAWAELHDLEFSLLQWRLADPLGYKESCWLRVTLKPRFTSLVTVSPSLLDWFIPKWNFPCRTKLKNLSRRLAFRVTYEAYVIGPFDVRDRFRKCLQRALIRHELDVNRVYTIKRILQAFSQEGTHHSDTRVGINDSWITVSPVIEMAVGSINTTGDIERLLDPIQPPLPQEEQKPQYIWKTGFLHAPNRTPAGVAGQVVDYMSRIVFSASSARTKEAISEALGVPAGLCAESIDLLKKELIVEEILGTADDIRPRYWLKQPQCDLTQLEWSPLFSHPQSQPRFNIRLSMSWINPLGPLLCALTTLITFLIAVASLIVGYLSWVKH